MKLVLCIFKKMNNCASFGGLRYSSSFFKWAVINLKCVCWSHILSKTDFNHLSYFGLVLLCFHARLFVDALWSPARKGLTSWLSFVVSNCDVVTFPLVSLVRCGA